MGAHGPGTDGTLASEPVRKDRLGVLIEKAALGASDTWHDECVGPSQVQDSDPSRLKGEFEDLSKVEKYEIGEEDYAKRTGWSRGGREGDPRG